MGGVVGTVMIFGAIFAFLPFFVAMLGRGAIWKFLTLIFCFLALFGAVTIIGGILAWCVAWVFASIAGQAGRRDRLDKQYRRKLLKAKDAPYDDRELMRNIRR